MSNLAVKLRWYDPIKVFWSIGWRSVVYILILTTVSLGVTFGFTYCGFMEHSFFAMGVNIVLSFLGMYVSYLPYKKLNGLTYRTFKITFPQPNTVSRRLKLILSYLIASTLAMVLVSVVFIIPFFFLSDANPKNLSAEFAAIHIFLLGLMLVSTVLLNYFLMKRWMTKGIFGQHLILVPRTNTDEVVPVLES